MKHLKTFESYSINEEEGIRKFFTGHSSKKDAEKAKEDFYKALDEAEEKYNEFPDKYVFNRKSLEKKAASNKYRGGLRIQIGGRDKSRAYVVYDEGTTGFQDITGGSGGLTSGR